MALGDQRRVPGPTVLLVECDQFAARRNPGGAAGLGEEHQRQQPGHLTVVRHEGADQASEPDRLGGQVVTYGVVVVHHLSLLLLVVALVLAPDPVDGLAVGGGGQPGAGVGGYAVGRPPLDGGRERLGRRLLGDVEVTETPGQGGDHRRPLLVVGLGDRLPHVDPVHRNGRTSTFRLQAFDPSAASLSATSRSGASMIQKPARYSFDSRKGPSVNIASSPRLSMTVAELGDARPPAKTQ